MPPWKPESSEPHPSLSQADFSAFPKKSPQPQLSNLPRTSSEPEVCVYPQRPQQSEFKALSKLPKPNLDSLPRTSSEPEIGLYPRKFPQLEGQGPPRKYSQPETNALPKKPRQAVFFGDHSRKPPLPGSVSESSLPKAVAGSSSRFPLSPGFGTRQQKSGALLHGGGSRLGLKPGHPPRQRPLPPVSSLGPPPAKPPLPPGLRDVQSFQRPSAAVTNLRKTCSSPGIHFQARQPTATLKDSEDIYELYDDVELTDRSPSPMGKGEVPSIQQPPRRPPQDPELRKEKAPQPQQLLPVDPKALKKIRKAEKAEKEFRKKFKFEGEIVIQTKMMIDPNAKTRRGGGKHLGIRRGEILEVIEYTNKEEMLCRDTKGKYGYVPRIALLPLETEVYDDVGFWDPLESQPFPRGQ
ncbi:unnamed protein product [Pipistrellus nathusii]|uniref:SH3 domain-containing protein n=1 Tax=Pipistrellus nathusii TaxID=59473 RepID=A0ABP0A6B1_PIPNA